MITIISGTNRLQSNTLKIANLTAQELEKNGQKTQLIDLTSLPRDLFIPENYGKPPASFTPYQNMILQTKGIVTVVPEYNGSFPGALKYFIDLLKFPESFQNMPCAFIGVAAGVFGALRSIEQLEMVYHYRGANLFNKFVLFPKVQEKLNAAGTEITDAFTKDLFQQFCKNFPNFANALQK